MAIKETPTNYRVYFKTMKNSIRPQYNAALDKYEKLLVEEKALHSEVLHNADVYRKSFKIILTDYVEIVKNKYIDGKFHSDAKGLFLNKKQNYTATTPLYKLYKLSREQKELYDLKNNIDLWEKMLDLTLNDYKVILETFYNEVHKKLIIEGLGYVYEQPLGWVCINRCKIVPGARKVLNFQATKRNKERLLAEGKRLWNEQEAEYALKVGIPYDGVDYRVYLNEEAAYEVPIINCRVTKGEKVKLEPAARRAAIQGRTDEQVIADCDNDMNKVCELPIDIKRKLYLCLKINDILYLNFIRNEAQQTAHTAKANRKG